ncbi:MAG TPA: type I-E CRISPR-associated protein Cse2/CasB [Bryobacteraceae bacterium]|nr:type I-E CRISPR-associated protein Cse2/CasB [Bryobacteraceae bacterium]
MKQDSIARFISRLETLGGFAPDSVPDRRALAALRRHLATWPAAPPEAVRVVAPFLPQQATGWWEDVYYVIAALFAMHPCISSKETGRGPSLGKALREAASGDSGQGPERRLLALLRCRSEDLPIPLRHVVSYLSARKISIDYGQLMRDLSWWDSGEGRVQRRWGRDFWSGTIEENQQELAELVVKENRSVH